MSAPPQRISTPWKGSSISTTTRSRQRVKASNRELSATITAWQTWKKEAELFVHDAAKGTLIQDEQSVKDGNTSEQVTEQVEQVA
ncbi:hypothetical protein ON010_g12525 [Phytophthora cinnamomi]|nr:hypothetical protein ON010_g12525 [Phytophthora cinnamomi]